MTNKLEGKVALVTGASRGIGAAIAQRLASDGASVVITYASSSQKAEEVVQKIQAAGGQARAIQVDSANPQAVKNVVNETVETFGRIDILVNNAGVAKFAPFADFSLEDFNQTMNVNVKAVFIASQEAIKYMKEGGRIITIGSTNAERMPTPYGALYAMSKAALVGLTKGMARDLGPMGITVNNVQPGPVDTDMNPASGPYAEMIKGFMALPRYGRAEEIAAMVSYLASPEAAYVTGASLQIDGGYAA
jgi:3-oxoacyl-[acyl-carrier protein] reductase